MTDTVAWREYTLRFPVQFAEQLEAAVADQSLLEERVVEVSEMLMWLTMLGLAQRAAILKADERKARRVVLPGEA